MKSTPFLRMAALAFAVMAPAAFAQDAPSAAAPGLGESPEAGIAAVAAVPAISPADILKTLPPPSEAPFVALVDTRYLTKAKLEERVNRLLMLKERRETWENAEEREQMRSQLSEHVVRDWVDLSVLAIQSMAEGFRVTPEKTEGLLQQIYAVEERLPGGQVNSARTAISALAISKEELVGFVNDAILAEELVKARLARMFAESDMKAVYELQPEKFVIPPRAHLYYLCIRLSGKETVAERRAAKTEIEKWSAQAEKAAKKDKFLELAQKFHDPKVLQFGGDFGWCTANALPRAVHKSSEEEKKKGAVSVSLDTSVAEQVFALKPGKVSDVLSCEFGYYVFQMVEFQPAAALDYDSSVDQVEAAVYEGVKQTTLQEIMPRHVIFTNTTGVDYEELARQLGKSPQDTAAEAEARRQKQIAGKKDYLALLEKQRMLLAEDKKTNLTGDPTKISADSLSILKKGKAVSAPDKSGKSGQSLLKK